MKKGPAGPFTTHLSGRTFFYWGGVSIAWIFRARESAQMSGTPPEANNEYSRAPGPSRGGLRQFRARDSSLDFVHFAGLGGLLAALLLIVAEFTTLYAVHVVGKGALVRSVNTGSHHDYALIPIGLLAAGLSLALLRGAGRPALVALVALGLITVVIGLLGDLPDAHKTGLIASGAGFELGTASPSAGFYLETTGAVLLLVAGGVGLLAGGGADPGAGETRPEAL